MGRAFCGGRSDFHGICFSFWMFLVVKSKYREKTVFSSIWLGFANPYAKTFTADNETTVAQFLGPFFLSQLKERQLPSPDDYPN